MQIPLDHATLIHAAADGESAAAAREIHAQVLAALKLGLGLEPRTHVQIRIVRSWPAYLLRGVGWLQTVLSIFVMPLLWYWLRFARGWNHVYAAAWIRGARRATLNVKSLDLLPAGLPPNLTASFSQQPQVLIDRPTLWREEVCRCLVVAYCYWRMPLVLLGGVARFVSRQVVPIPNSEPAEWGRVMRWAGQPPPALDLRKVDELSQPAVDELVARLIWPYGVVRYLEERHPGLLRNVLAMSLPRDKVAARLAGDLGLPPDQVWTALAHQAAEHFGGGPALHEPSGQDADSAAMPGQRANAEGRRSDNPYSSPRLESPVPSSAFGARSGGSLLTLVLVVCTLAAGLFAGSLLDPLVNWPTAVVYLLTTVGGLLIGQIVYVACRVVLDLLLSRRR